MSEIAPGPVTLFLKDQIDKAINEIKNESRAWQHVIEGLVEDLIREGQSTLANELKALLAAAARDAGIQARCGADFITRRALQSLAHVKSAITSEEVKPCPTFCLPDPPFIDLRLSPDRRYPLMIDGYDIDASQISVVLVDQWGREQDVSRHLRVPTSYLLTLDVTQSGVPFSRTSDHLIFRLPQGQQLTLDVVQPVWSRIFEISSGTINVVDGGAYRQQNDWPIFYSKELNLNKPKDAYDQSWWTGKTKLKVDKQAMGRLRLDINLNDDLSISVNGVSYLYDRSWKDGTTTQRKADPFNYKIHTDETQSYTKTLKDDSDEVTFSLSFANRKGYPFSWLGASGGAIPGGAVKGGQEPGRDLYVCRAAHQGGIHPGWAAGDACHIGWGGEEVAIPEYEVLCWSEVAITRCGLRAANGSHVCAEGGGGQRLVANRPWLKEWETFDLLDLGGGKVALRACDGSYVCAEAAGEQPLVANRADIGGWETFRRVDLGGGRRVRLIACNGKYVCAEGGGGRELIANRAAAHAWETFEVVPVG